MLFGFDEGDAAGPRAGVFDCKPLPLLWAKFPEHYGEHNTVMLDDLARNYVYNKQNGLVIRPFRSPPVLRAWETLVQLQCPGISACP